MLPALRFLAAKPVPAHLLLWPQNLFLRIYCYIVYYFVLQLLALAEDYGQIHHSSSSPENTYLQRRRSQMQSKASTKCCREASVNAVKRRLMAAIAESTLRLVHVQQISH
jgi:hypothetical protein